MVLMRITCLAVFLILFGGGFAPVGAVVPCTDSAACRTTMEVEGRKLVLYVSAPLDLPQPDIRRAIVVIHGTDGNADGYFRTMVRSAAMADKATDTLVIAPRFIEEGDRDKPGPGEFFWNHGADWRAGDLSSRDTPPRVSSFDLMNRLLEKLADRAIFPNLAAIVIAGHSAGGQFVQRYAIGQPENPVLAGMRLRYIVANPSSYLYLDGRRPDPAKPGAFTIPSSSACQANKFKYGFEQPNSYFKPQSVDDMITRYRSRKVIYLLGEADTNPNAAGLSQTCAAKAQGSSRLARGKNFMASMDALYQPHAHRLVTVPFVGHSSMGMFQSVRGLKALFED